MCLLYEAGFGSYSVRVIHVQRYYYHAVSCFASFLLNSVALEKMEWERQRAVGETWGARHSLTGRPDIQSIECAHRDLQSREQRGGGAMRPKKRITEWTASVEWRWPQYGRNIPRRHTARNPTYYDKWIWLKRAWIWSFFRWIIISFFSQNSFPFWFHHHSSAVLHWNVRRSSPGRVWNPV